MAFQLTNFLRDVGEDLDRGRVYLPADELAAFGVDRELLTGAAGTGGPTRGSAGRWPTWSRTPGRSTAAPHRASAMLEPVSRACVRCAFTLYRGILDEIEAADYDVLHRRVAVSAPAAAAVALPGLARALRGPGGRARLRTRSVARRRVRTPWPGRGA